MAEDTETIQIECPLCGKKHEYRLKVDRSTVMYQMRWFPAHEEKAVVHFTRFFTCPKLNESFQANLRMEQSFGTVINDVKVL
jgi:hypothetical protein